MSTPRRVALIVRLNEGFDALRQNLSQLRYEVLHATSAAKALTLCETRRPRLLVIPTDLALDGLDEALARVCNEETFILGVAPSSAARDAAERQPEIYNRVILDHKGSAFLRAARAALSDSRRMPQVNLEFPVNLGGDRSGIVRQFGASTLQVETDARLEAGRATQVEITWGPKPSRFMAVVGKVQSTPHADRCLAVLYVHPQEAGAKRYLEELTRRMIDLQRLVDGRKGKEKGRSTWRMTRRAEETLRGTKGVVVRDSGRLAVITGEPGEVVDLSASTIEERYEILDEVGTWGVGYVTRARHRLLNRTVLLKVLRAELRDDMNARRRMRHEAKATAALAGRYVPDALDFGDDGKGGLYYATEDLTGETLASTMAKGRVFGPLETAALGVHLASALALVHLRDRAHFDLCPENIFLHRPGGTSIRPYLINFGDRQLWKNPQDAHARGQAYRPPECEDANLGPKCDIHALSLILQEIMSSTLAEIPADAATLSRGEQDLVRTLTAGCSPVIAAQFPDAEAFSASLKAIHARFAEDAPAGFVRFVEPPPGSAYISERPTPITDNPALAMERPTPVTELPPPPSPLPASAESPYENESTLPNLPLDIPPGDESFIVSLHPASPPPAPDLDSVGDRRGPRDVPYFGTAAIIGVSALVTVTALLFFGLIGQDPNREDPSERSVASSPRLEEVVEVPELPIENEPVVDEQPEVYLESDQELLARRAGLMIAVRERLDDEPGVEVLKQIEEAIAIRDGAEARYLLARYLAEQQDHRGGLAQIERATAFAPTNFAYHELRGELLLHLDRRREACASFLRAQELQPDQRSIRRHLGRHCD